MSFSLIHANELTSLDLLIRIFVAVLIGCVVGTEREYKNRPAGLRTHVLVCLGACMIALAEGLFTANIDTSTSSNVTYNFGRLCAQVISGIGFLGAGTIIVTGRQEVKGMTTAAGLWASACTGLAIGAGFYECVLLAFLLISLVIRVLPYVENYIVENARNMNIYVEFNSLDDVGDILNRIKSQNVQIYDVELDHGREEKSRHPSAVFSIRLNQKQMHTQVLAAISELESVRTIDEI